MTKIGFLFGAGAEISYGMPTGGKFALDIFRRDTTSAKQVFRDNRSRIDLGSRYASSWLPEGFNNKNVGSFGDSVYENIVKSTIGNNRDDIINRINNFDDIANAVLDNMGINQDDFKKAVKDDLGISFGDITVNQRLSYNKHLKDGDKLFKSEFFAVLLRYYEIFEFSSIHKEFFGKILKSIFQLHIGALSETLSRNLQESILDRHDLELDFFDDLGGNLSVNYQMAGVRGLELLASNKPTGLLQIIEFSFGILEKIYVDVLDYKSIIDKNWHYLYIPKKEWGKFCKISIFLHSVREYIETECKYDKNNDGYYDDLNAQKQFDVCTVATSNYVNSLIESKLPKLNITFLNGSVSEYYNPYMNSIVSKEEFKKMKQFAVPMIFTQSGTKPMTSIDMSIKYVEYYNNLKEADFICSIGFGFNIDDEHINGIIRNLIENSSKKLVVIDIANGKSEYERKTELAKKLKITDSSNIKMVIVDNNRSINGLNWTEYIVSEEFLEGIE
ncbi:hypothetical protein BVE84_01445 [Streptococcus azizii]|uniref:SIR2-like domain-containing protein n=2 Tax=Streptococcus TaxID=1301 RepID=A0AB36JPZ5_9STRE|nr:hypothetical protein [Streptococcus azizii]ONK29644.1 hypothetical protein BVE86_00135 [Streptococcus azizii]ONK30152.1 hypothetical protein BVE85_01445 [Streptococcus azizii]ONK30928.1 hypothetical protein BVE84_01445 [Streptococcus azizii]